MENIVFYLIASLSGLIGIIIGGKIAYRLNKSNNELEFKEKQFKKFYSPLYEIHKQIRLLAEFRTQLNRGYNERWKGLNESAGKIIDKEERLRYFHAMDKPEYKEQIKNNNEILKKKLLPAYKQMVRHFKEYYYLAEDETKHFFPVLSEYADGINSEDFNLIPFHQHIEKVHNELSNAIKND